LNVSGCWEAVESLNGDKLVVRVPPTEFLLGVADFTGELMRIAVRNVGLCADNACAPHNICMFLRELSTAMLSYSLTGRDMQCKLSTMKQSIAKVEAVCYMQHVRGSELPQNLLTHALASQPNYGGISDESVTSDNFG
jgi:predicted translin family RNA/ssDNA-binding protein